MQSRDPDHNLFQRLRGRDERAFSDFADQHGEKIMCWLIGWTRGYADDGERADLLEDTFVHVWDHCAEHKPEKGAFMQWVYLKTREIARAHRRREARRDQLLAEHAGTLEALHQPGLTDVEVEQLKLLIKEALSALPPNQQRACEMHFLEGYTQEEIADAHNHSRSWVSRIISRGEQLIHEHIHA